MDIKNQVAQMDILVAQGAIVEAVKNYFSDDAKTSDFSGIVTENKVQMIEKMEGFTGAIAAVNGITLHQTLVDGYTSTSEFTFDFSMKEGGNILWHEIIKRNWNANGMVVRETYFKAN